MVQKLSESFPALNLEWFINGNGKMYKSDSPASYTGVQSAAQVQEQSLFDIESEMQAPNQAAYSVGPKATTSYKEHQVVKTQRNVVRVLVFFDDGTFQELNCKPR